MTAKHRPLSPHLQVYRLPLTGLISISHRMTGVLLSFGLLSLVWILISVAIGEQAYQLLQQQLLTLVGKLLYAAMIYALLFHLCHGVRHLCWDIGHGFERSRLLGLAVLELLVSVILTALWLYFTL